MKNLLTLSLLLSLNLGLAQPQWKFHIAFEDATGAKDTIWLIWDSTATVSGVDYNLGEGPVNIDNNTFNVFTRNLSGDTTKTVAKPYYSPYPFLFGVLGVSVIAINYQYPITIQWDSSLFNASYLPPPEHRVTRARIDNEYFFGVNNTGYDHYNMLIDNEAYAPAFWWGSQSQFPITFSLSLLPVVGINTNYRNKDITIFPNPLIDQLLITTKKEISVEIFSIRGDLLISETNIKGSKSFDLSNLSRGIYFLRCLIEKKHTYYEKIIKF